MGRTGEPVGSIQFTFLFLRGGRPPYLPVELWEDNKRRKKEQYIHRVSAADGRGTPFHPGLLFWRRFIGSLRCCCLADYQHDHDNNENNTAISDRFSWLAATTILIPCCFDHFTLFFLLLNMAIRQPCPLFSEWISFDYSLRCAAPFRRKLISSRAQFKLEKSASFTTLPLRIAFLYVRLPGE